MSVKKVQHARCLVFTGCFSYWFLKFNSCVFRVERNSIPPIEPLLAIFWTTDYPLTPQNCDNSGVIRGNHFLGETSLFEPQNAENNF